MKLEDFVIKEKNEVVSKTTSKSPIDNIDINAKDIRNEFPKIKYLWSKISPNLYVKSELKYILNHVFEKAHMKLNKATGFALHKRLLKILIDFNETKITEILVSIILTSFINARSINESLISEDVIFIALNILIPKIVKANYTNEELAELMISLSLLLELTFPDSKKRINRFIRKVIRKTIPEDDISEKLINGITKQKQKIFKSGNYGIEINLNNDTIRLLNKLNIPTEEILKELKQIAQENNPENEPSDYPTMSEEAKLNLAVELLNSIDINRLDEGFSETVDIIKKNWNLLKSKIKGSRAYPILDVFFSKTKDVASIGTGLLIHINILRGIADGFNLNEDLPKFAVWLLIFILLNGKNTIKNFIMDQAFFFILDFIMPFFEKGAGMESLAIKAIVAMAATLIRTFPAINAIDAIDAKLRKITNSEEEFNELRKKIENAVAQSGAVERALGDPLKEFLIVKGFDIDSIVRNYQKKSKEGKIIEEKLFTFDMVI